MNKHAPEEYYHIYNRGIQKQPIFNTDEDRLRFLFLILIQQGKSLIRNLGRELKASEQHRMLLINDELIRGVVLNRNVELVAFCLMPNHFHLIVREVNEGGISKYMQRVQNAYTKYFNTKYNKSGHLFQGSYRSKHVTDDAYLLHLSAYVHKNPAELMKGRWIEEAEEGYYWSSFQDYIKSNRFPQLLSPKVIIDRYLDGKEHNMTYKKFVKTSLAKEWIGEFNELIK
ncbi:MAG: transposase [Minisyncoccia bacterium]